LGFGFSTPSCICCMILATSFSEIGVGLVAVPPTKPVTLAVFFTKCQVSSSISISTST
jgi:hypothetical protein